MPPTDSFLATLADRAAPPPRALTNREFAATVTLPDGPQAGEKYEPDSEPAQSVILDVLDGKILDATGKPFRDLVYVAATQVGKSLVAIIVPSMLAVTSNDTVIYCLPTGDIIGKVWTTKLLPTIRGCGFGDWLPDGGPGSRGGKPSALVMRNPITGRRAGTMIFMAGGEGKKREVGQAGVTARTVLIDEADEYEDAHRVALIRQRAASFGHEAVTITASTVKKDQNSVILALYYDSTASRLWFACPHCGRYQPLEWDHVRYDPADDLTASDTARYYCIHCATGWDERDRRRALAKALLVHSGQQVDEHAHVIGSAPRTRSIGLRCSKLDYKIGLSLGDLATEHRRAKAGLETTGDHGLMRSFYRDRLSLEYTAELEEMELNAELTWRNLLVRSQRCAWGPTRVVTDRSEDRQPTYSRHMAEPPSDALGTVCGIDVQHDRLYWVLVAYATNGTTYDCAWGYEYGREDRTPANVGELHACLDRVDAVCRDYSGSLPFVSGGVDVGDQTDALMSWIKGRRPLWKPTKGASNAIKDEPGDVSGLVHNRDGLLLVATDAAREMIHSAYRRPNGEPGACHIPSGLQNTATDTAYLRHICAEKQVLDPKTKKFKIIRGPGRWDWQDARRIAEVMLRLQLRPRRTAPTRKYGAVGAVFRG